MGVVAHQWNNRCWFIQSVTNKLKYKIWIIIFLHNSLMIPFSQISSKSHSSIAFMVTWWWEALLNFSWLMILLINIREMCVLIESIVAKWKRALEKKYSWNKFCPSEKDFIQILFRIIGCVYWCELLKVYHFKYSALS
jgi:hypothetical protein